MNVTGDRQSVPVAKPRYDLWHTKEPEQARLVWQLQGGAAGAPDVGDALTRDAILRLTRPIVAGKVTKWWKWLAVLPCEFEEVRTEGDWRRYGLVAVLNYQTGLRTHLEVWRNPETKQTQCITPSWVRSSAWFGGWSLEVGPWARDLWVEAVGRCHAAGVKLGPLKTQENVKLYHRVWGVPRAGRLLGPNGYGEEIEARAEKRSDE